MITASCFRLWGDPVNGTARHTLSAEDQTVRLVRPYDPDKTADLERVLGEFKEVGLDAVMVNYHPWTEDRWNNAMLACKRLEFPVIPHIGQVGSGTLGYMERYCGMFAKDSTGKPILEMYHTAWQRGGLNEQDLVDLSDTFSVYLNSAQKPSPLYGYSHFGQHYNTWDQVKEKYLRHEKRMLWSLPGFDDHKLRPPGTVWPVPVSYADRGFPRQTAETIADGPSPTFWKANTRAQVEQIGGEIIVLGDACEAWEGCAWLESEEYGTSMKECLIEMVAELKGGTVTPPPPPPTQREGKKAKIKRLLKELQEEIDD